MFHCFGYRFFFFFYVPCLVQAWVVMVFHISLFRCSYHFRFLYFHPFTEALCIDNSLSSSATLSFDLATYAKAFYFFISHYMSKEAHLSASYRNYKIPCCCHSPQDFFIRYVLCVGDSQDSSVKPHFNSL